MRLQTIKQQTPIYTIAIVITTILGDGYKYKGICDICYIIWELHTVTESIQTQT